MRLYSFGPMASFDITAALPALNHVVLLLFEQFIFLPLHNVYVTVSTSVYYFIVRVFNHIFQFISVVAYSPLPF
jgi:hypothetical protein